MLCFNPFQLPGRVALRRALVQLAAALLVLAVLPANALPIFARQTGQNCLSCHAGGQFPELTPYGRMFKMTGYTIGARTLPLSVMALASDVSVADTLKSDNPQGDFQKNNQLLFATGSVFLAGKVTDNIGAFAQITYDNYATQDQYGVYHGHTQADNMDFRYADHFIDATRDLVVGATLNNNPSVSDPWNTAAAWMQYVPVPSPSAYAFIDGTTPYPGYGSGGNIAGLSAYLFWNKTVYAELGSYRTANEMFSFMSFNIDDAGTTKLSGNRNPYWRFALSHEWGASNLMVGTSGMVAHVFDAGSDINNPDNLGSFRNTGVDAQYQYLLDPHTFTLQAAYMRQVSNYSAATLAATGGVGSSPYFLADGVTPGPTVHSSDTSEVVRLKASYIYRATYGGSLAYFASSGSTSASTQSYGYTAPGVLSYDPAVNTQPGGNLTGNPAITGVTYEAFFMPVQYVRIGAQLTSYSKYNGASSNYNGFGRNAKDNNSAFLYVWAAY
jgi:hypothetical protein